MDPRIDLLVTDYHLRDGETGIQVIGLAEGGTRPATQGRAHDG